jgi:hypothetical protein
MRKKMPLKRCIASCIAAVSSSTGFKPGLLRAEPAPQKLPCFDDQENARIVNNLSA